MIRFHVIGIFPDLVGAFARTSLVGKAADAGLVDVRAIDLRDFAASKHRSTDDAPYGGGPGMVMLAEPILRALEALPAGAHKVLLDPGGRPFDQSAARRLAAKTDVALVCGRYEGFDERVRSRFDEEISLGDFVLAGGEVAAMAVVEATARLVPGVLGNDESPTEESFAHGPLLEYPQYTRPADLDGEPVPEVLLSGDHAKVARWRKEQALARTRTRRPDLYAPLVMAGAAPRPVIAIAYLGTATDEDLRAIGKIAQAFGAGSVVTSAPALQTALGSARPPMLAVVSPDGTVAPGHLLAKVGERSLVLVLGDRIPEDLLSRADLRVAPLGGPVLPSFGSVAVYLDRMFGSGG